MRAADVWARFEILAARHANRVAVIDGTGETTWAELVDEAGHVAAGLTDLGVRAGDRVGAFEPNRTRWLTFWLGACRVGASLVGLNTRFRKVELDHLLQTADVRVLLCPDGFLGIDTVGLMASLDQCPPLVVDGDASGFAGMAIGWRELVERHVVAPTPAAISDMSGTEWCVGFTTSGTTGFPKIAIHDHHSTLSHADVVVESCGLDASSVALVALPLCGVFGFTTMLPTLLAGGTVVLHETWDPGEVARAVTTHDVTFMNGADDMILDVVEHPDFEPATTWTVAHFADFTNAADRCVQRAVEVTGARLRPSGVYGSSEGFALMSRWPASDTDTNRARNGGRLNSETYAVRARDPESGDLLPFGTPGELEFRGANYISTYLNNPEATAAAFTDDGWFRSGDLGEVLDDRTFVYLARMGDSLRLRGFLCDPSEIEHHLELREEVDLAQVVAVTQAGVGDVAVAFVRTSAGLDGSAELRASLTEHCRAGLANYKRPAWIEFVTEFPVTEGANGVKIRKVELRARATELIEDPPLG